MKIIGGGLSPYVQRVILAAHLKGHEIEMVPPPGGELDTPEFTAINPMRRIPVLVTDEGWTIPESAAIVAYLEENLAGPSVWPENVQDRARARVLTQITESDFAPGLVNLLRARMGARSQLDTGNGIDPDAFGAFGLEQMHRAADAIAKLRDANDDWLVGERMSMADATFIPFMLLKEVTAPFNDFYSRIALPASLEDYFGRMSAKPHIDGVRREMQHALELLKTQWGLVRN